MDKSVESLDFLSMRQDFLSGYWYQSNLLYGKIMLGAVTLIININVLRTKVTSSTSLMA